MELKILDHGKNNQLNLINKKENKAMFNIIIAKVRSELKASIANRAQRKGLEVKASKVIVVTWNEDWSVR